MSKKNNFSDKVVYILEYNPDYLNDISILVKSNNYQCITFSSTQKFLDAFSTDMSGCLIINIDMPDINGLSLQKKLIKKRSALPIIFFTAKTNNTKIIIEAIQLGALSFLQYPLDNKKLIALIEEAFFLEKHRKNYLQEYKINLMNFKNLTHREKQIFYNIVEGLSNKKTALKLNISQRTVETHRARIMKKMQAKSLAKLIEKAFWILNQISNGFN